jgi:hypothetical protein
MIATLFAALALAAPSGFCSVGSHADVICGGPTRAPVHFTPAPAPTRAPVHFTPTRASVHFTPSSGRPLAV